MKRFEKYLKILLSIILIFSFSACKQAVDSTNKDFISSKEEISQKAIEKIDKNKPYYKMEDVAAYIYTYNKLPKNYLTKKEAKKLGWNPKEGNLWEVTDKGVIGGDYFGNYEKILPEADYKEADVNYEGGKRNAERLIFDNEKNIYYTNDHYESFERVY